MAEKVSQEEAFREGLAAMVALGEALKPYCQTLEDAIVMSKLGLESEGQFKVLMKLVTGKK